MPYNRNFLPVVLTATIVVVCCDNGWCAMSSNNLVVVDQKTVNETSVITAVKTTERADPTTKFTTKTLCDSGEYVSKCRGYRVGFNWMKSAKIPIISQDANEGTGEEASIALVETKNYYIGDTTLDLFKQMQTFFGHRNDHIYTISYIQDETTGQTGIASLDQLEEDRELILNSICHPKTSSWTCTKCPNGGTVPESTVDLDADNAAVRGSWNFYTIADCYINEFEDSTGSYFYVPENINNDAAVAAVTEGTECYYTNTNPNALDALNGDKIGTFVPALYESQTDNTTSIPSNNQKKFSIY